MDRSACLCSVSENCKDGILFTGVLTAVGVREVGSIRTCFENVNGWFDDIVAETVSSPSHRLCAAYLVRAVLCSLMLGRPCCNLILLVPQAPMPLEDMLVTSKKLM